MVAMAQRESNLLLMVLHATKVRHKAGSGFLLVRIAPHPPNYLGRGGIDVETCIGRRKLHSAKSPPSIPGQTLNGPAVSFPQQRQNTIPSVS